MLLRQQPGMGQSLSDAHEAVLGVESDVLLINALV
jgi:hypothetical protein